MSDDLKSLPDYEGQFACRFTAEDAEYQKCLERGTDTPPTGEDLTGFDSGNNGSPKLAANYEVQFAHRFTQADETYQNYLKRGSDPPPIVEDWRSRGGGHSRGRDYRCHENHSHRGQDRRRGWSGDRWGPQQWHDRRRAEGQGQYYPHSGYHNSYNQGYNSYNQRPHDSRY